MIAIAGGGGVALLFCIMSLILVAMRRKKNRNNESNNESSTPTTGILFINFRIYGSPIIMKSNSILLFYRMKIIYFKVNRGPSVDQGSTRSQSDPTREKNPLNVVENPYYGDAEDFEINTTRKSASKPDFDNVEVVTATENLYYEI